MCQHRLVMVYKKIMMTTVLCIYNLNFKPSQQNSKVRIAPHFRKKRVKSGKFSSGDCEMCLLFTNDPLVSKY